VRAGSSRFRRGIRIERVVGFITLGVEGVSQAQGAVRGGGGGRGRWLGSLLFFARCDARDRGQARERVHGWGSIPRPGLAMAAAGLVGLIEHRLVLVARPATVVGVKKGVIVPSLSSSYHRLRRLIEGHLQASTLHEVRGGKPRVVRVEGVSWG
jgi:hypothetical protein